MLGVIARILLRVTSGYMIAGGWLPVDMADLADNPDAALLIEQVLGAGVWATTEVYYIAAKRYGWAT